MQKNVVTHNPFPYEAEDFADYRQLLVGGIGSQMNLKAPEAARAEPPAGGSEQHPVKALFGTD